MAGVSGHCPWRTSEPNGAQDKVMVHTDVEWLNGCSAGTGYNTCIHACCCFWFISVWVDVLRWWQNFTRSWKHLRVLRRCRCNTYPLRVLRREALSYGVFDHVTTQSWRCFRSGSFSILGGQGLNTKNLVRAQKMLGGGGERGKRREEKYIWGQRKIPWKHARNWRNTGGLGMEGHRLSQS